MHNTMNSEIKSILRAIIKDPKTPQGIANDLKKVWGLYYQECQERKKEDKEYRDNVHPI